VVAGASLVACHNTTSATATGDEVAIPAAPPTSSTAAAPAPPDAAPAATAGEVDAGLGLGALAGGDLRTDGGGPIRPGLLSLRTSTAVYGPAPSDRGDAGGMLLGEIALATPTVTKGSLTNHERVLAGVRPRLRSCYTRGLRSDPTQQGVVAFVIDVGANGEVTKADATGPLSHEVIACMRSALSRLAFDPPGAPAQVTTKATLTPQQR
jgi:hypothetical protein